MFIQIVIIRLSWAEEDYLEFEMSCGTLKFEYLIIISDVCNYSVSKPDQAAREHRRTATLTLTYPHGFTVKKISY